MILERIKRKLCSLGIHKLVKKDNETEAYTTKFSCSRCGEPMGLPSYKESALPKLSTKISNNDLFN
jgi:hypothetical protein